jgi:serine/threonine protein kinase
MAEQTVLARVRELGTREALAADPRFAGIVENVFPLTGQLGNTRTRVKTLGEGTFGRVNLEEVNAGKIAAKYFTDPTNFVDNVSELAVLKDLQGLPYVAQLVGINTKPAALAVNFVAPAPNVAPLNFPVALMGKAVADLSDRSLYTNWNDLERTVIQVLKGIAIMHTQGIVHRDIKPQNMLMTAAKEVWISDFGKAKYIDTELPKTLEVYTGTYWFSAPELLMKSILGYDRSVSDYEKSDMWAIGATLYYIVTGQYLFAYNSRREILDAMFIRAGLPGPGDGETGGLFVDYEYAGALPSTLSHPAAYYVRNDEAYKQRAIDRAVYRPADPARLETIATVIQSLMTYNPDSRPTALEALRAITGEDFAVPPRRSILDQYVNTTPLPASIAKDDYENTLIRSYIRSTFYLNKPELPFTLDRMCIFIRAFVQRHPTNFLTISNLVALAITDALLDTSAGEKTFGPEEITIAFTGGPPSAVITNDINACLQAYMMSDIQYLGKTFFDDLVESEPPFSRKKIQTLGLLNFLCHTYSIFPLYVGHLDILKQRILEYVADPARIQVKDYLRTRFSPVLGGILSPVVTNFLTYIREPLRGAGGRRRHRMTRKKVRKSKGKTRQRKH